MLGEVQLNYQSSQLITKLKFVQLTFKVVELIDLVLKKNLIIGSLWFILEFVSTLSHYDFCKTFSSSIKKSLFGSFLDYDAITFSYASPSSNPQQFITTPTIKGLEFDTTIFSTSSDQILNAALKLVTKLREKHSYTDAANFT